MTVIGPRQPDDDLPAVTQRLLTRRRFLALLGVAGLGAYSGARAWGLPDDFYIRTEEPSTPVFDPATYRLQVDGLVQRPLSFTYHELMSLPPARQTCDFLCIEGWGVTDVPWHGVRLRTLMLLARPLADAHFVTFHCLGDVYRESLSLEQAEMPSALLAYRMYGRPLLPERGSPLRLVFPRMLGYKGAKWVTRVEFRAARDRGYWESYGAPLDPWVGDEQPCSTSWPGWGLSCGPRPWSDLWRHRQVTPTPIPPN
jgi:DMSO/TMAO reductase YedYZ molybdopterin-dependent catalytic subunit